MHGCRSRHRVAREKKGREEHEAELEEEAKGEQWAIERREYNMSPEFSMRGTRCEFSFAVDGKMLQFSLGLRVGALTVRCFFNDMENFTSKNPMEDTRCLPRDVAGDKKSLFFRSESEQHKLPRSRGPTSQRFDNDLEGVKKKLREWFPP